MSHIKSIMRKSTRQPSDRLNIVTFPTHERYESGFSNINALFFLWQGQGIKPWYSKYAPLPQNHILLNPKYSQQLPDHITPDLVLSQNKLAHYETSKEIAQKWNIPLVCLEHTLPMPTWSKAQIRSICNMRGDYNIFISEHSKNMWIGHQDDIVIHHGIDTELFKPIKKEKGRQNIVLSVVNDWVNRDQPCGFRLWQAVTGHPVPVFPIFVAGDTPGLSSPAPSVQALVEKYNNCSVFLNTSQVSPVPTAMMEAASCGLPIVSTNNCMIPEVIQHGYNGFLSNDPVELRKYCIDLLADEDMRNEIGANARKSIVEKFPMSNFERSWDELFRKVVAV